MDWLGALKSCTVAYNNVLTRKTYMEFLPKWLSLDRVRYTISKLETMGALERKGVGKGTKYRVVKMPDQIDI